MSTEAADPAALALVLTTVGDEAAAEQLARALVEARLAACVQIDAIRSLYRWNGMLCDEREWRLAIKTTRARLPELEQALRRQHPYELPQIVGVAVDFATSDYAAWVEAQTAPVPPR
jgi:periplasmic divalent cation tolerance protein